MPLQIRRGTNAEREALIPSNGLVVGELLYVSDTQQLFIGVGTGTYNDQRDYQGIAVTGYTDENAIDAVGAALVAGTHSNISFTYGTTQDTAGRIDAEIILSDYRGTIRADAFKGSVFADDGSTIGGTLLVDAVDGVLRGELIGTLTGNVTGNLTGNTTGTHFGNVTGTLTGDTNGYHTGDVKGSIFADNSSVMVDAISNNLYGNFSGNVTTENIDIPDASFGLQINSKKDASFGVNYHKGTQAARLAISAGEDVGAISIKGWDGSAYQFAGAIFAAWEAGATITDIAPKSTITLASGKGGVDNQFASLDSNGIWLSPISKTTVYSVAGTALPSASTMGAGARAFVSDATVSTFATAYTGGGANNVPVYSDGTIWRIG